MKLMNEKRKRVLYCPVLRNCIGKLSEKNMKNHPLPSATNMALENNEKVLDSALASIRWL